MYACIHVNQQQVPPARSHHVPFVACAGTAVKSLRLRPNKAIQQQVHDWMAEHGIDAQAAAGKAKAASKECFRNRSRTARCFMTLKRASPPAAPPATSNSRKSSGNSIPSAASGDKSALAQKSWRRACAKALSGAFGPYWYSDNPYAFQSNVHRDSSISTAACWV